MLQKLRAWRFSKMRLGVGAEMFKFFVYCFFPVGIIYLFNRPDLQQHWILGGALISQPGSTKDLLYGLPNDKEGMESFVEKFKRMKRDKEKKSEE